MSSTSPAFTYSILWSIGEESKKKTGFHKLQFKLNYQGTIYGNYRTKDLFARKTDFKKWQLNPRKAKELAYQIELERRKIEEAFRKTVPFEKNTFKKLYQNSAGIYRESNQSNVKEVIDEIVATKKKTKSKSWYKDAYNSFNAYNRSIGNADDTLTFENFNRKFLEEWEEWCRLPHKLKVKKLANKNGDYKWVEVVRKCGNRGIHNYAKAMWAAFTVAKEDGIFLGEIPFGEGRRKYLPPPKDEFKQTISEEDIDKLKYYIKELDEQYDETTNINHKKHLEAKQKAVKVALFCYYANGGNPADLCRLKMAQFTNSPFGLILPYQRRKTNTIHTRRSGSQSSTGSDIVAELVMPYCMDYINQDGYLLGVVDDTVSEDRKERRIKFWTRAINNQLKTVAKDLNIGDGKLTLQMLRGTLFNHIYDSYDNEQEGKEAASAVAAHMQIPRQLITT
jgi:hypothetical protein